MYKSIDSRFKVGRFSKAEKKLNITVGYSKPAITCCDTAVPVWGWALNFALAGPEGEVQRTQAIAEAIFPWMWKNLV